jgi:sulfite dehydrogenase
VELSFDDGKTWTDATLNPELGKYSWRRWKYSWVPENKGKAQIKVRATDNTGRTQPEKQWNRSGYARGFIEQLAINVN